MALRVYITWSGADVHVRLEYSAPQACRSANGLFVVIFQPIFRSSSVTGFSETCHSQARWRLATLSQDLAEVPTKNQPFLFVQTNVHFRLMPQGPL